jgi:hypothetical protein
MNTPTRLLAAAMAMAFLSGCSVHLHSRSEGPASGPEKKRETTGETRTRATQPAKLHIPPGHLPDPGQCRIWFPGTPPGQQPPAGDCAELSAQVPPGAWLISRTSKKSKEFDVAVYDSVMVGLVLEIRIYSTKDGSFLGYR